MNRTEKRAIRFAKYQEDPLLTSKLVIDVDSESFFQQFGILSFQLSDTKAKFPYATLAGLPIQAVAGMYDQYTNNQNRFTTRYFILVKRADLREVRDFLGQQHVQGITADRMNPWNDRIRQRVLATLAMHTLGRVKRDIAWMYHEGSLLLFDEINFDFDLEKKGLVCLKMEIDRFLTLVARTQTYSHPESVEELKKCAGAVFQLSSVVDGECWSGKSLKPISLPPNLQEGLELEKYFIKKKLDEESKNQVPYWPYDPEKYVHGKMYVMRETVQQVNALFEGMIHLRFNEVTDYEYDEYASEKQMKNYLKSYLAGRTIRINDPFGTARSSFLIEDLIRKCHHEELLGDDIQFTINEGDAPLVISLCESLKLKKVEQSYYRKLQEREVPEIIQHMIVEFPNGRVPKQKEQAPADCEPEETDPTKKRKKAQKKNISKERRILLELMVKECIRNRHLPAEMVEAAPGWTFWEYQIIDSKMIGSWMRIQGDGRLEFGPYYTSTHDPMLYFNEFALVELHYKGNTNLFPGSQDYKVLMKDGNVYLILTTAEVPILDGDLINEEYERIEAADDTLSAFKRVEKVHRYFRGYIGFHFWEVEPFDKVLRSFAYISGYVKTKLQLSIRNNLDRLPHMRLLLLLSAERPDLVDEQLAEIKDLLKYGLGRWNEMMTYPYPFKLLAEYLDDQTERTYGFHWDQISDQRIKEWDVERTKKLANDGGAETFHFSPL